MRTCSCERRFKNWMILSTGNHALGPHFWGVGFIYLLIHTQHGFRISNAFLLFSVSFTIVSVCLDNSWQKRAEKKC